MQTVFSRFDHFADANEAVCALQAKGIPNEARPRLEIETTIEHD